MKCRQDEVAEWLRRWTAYPLGFPRVGSNPIFVDHFYQFTQLLRAKCPPNRDFMLSLSGNNQADIIEAFTSTSRYLDDLLNIDNPYFEQMVGQIYPTELQLNKANSSDAEAPFLDLNLSITNGIVSSKIYDKRDDFNFEIVNFPFPDGDVPRSPSYGVYISLLIRFARVCSNVDDFNKRNLFCNC